MTRAGSIAAVLFCVGCCGPAALAGAAGLSPDEVFARVSPSVVTVRTFDQKRAELGQGSGVVVAREQVATNCHVVRDSSEIRIDAAPSPLIARWTHVEGERDLCLLSVANMTAPPVALRAAASVVVGERVVAVGNPLGFGLAASSGLIVTIPIDDAERPIVTSAPVSPGSSGGGLFDLEGRLIGLTTAILGTGQNLNLVLAADGIAQLRVSGKPPASTVTAPGPEPRWIEEGDALGSAADWRGSKLMRAHGSTPSRLRRRHSSPSRRPRRKAAATRKLPTQSSGRSPSTAGTRLRGYGRH